MFGVGVVVGVVIPKAIVSGAVIVTAGAVNPRIVEDNVMVLGVGVVTDIATLVGAVKEIVTAGKVNPVGDKVKVGEVTDTVAGAIAVNAKPVGE